MLTLDSARWKELRHAYGPAVDIPALLRAAAEKPLSHSYKDEPWFSLWSALAHQGSVYTASYAAVPHLLAIAQSKPRELRLHSLLLAGTIEKCREGLDAAQMPEDIREEYFAAIADCAELAHDLMRTSGVATDLQGLFSVFAACKGFHTLAEAIDLLDEVDQKLGAE
jgi:hypothetical protein